MEMNNDFRSEVHVAQKSRRDKLRIQQDHRLNPTHHELSAYNNNAHSLQQQIHAEQDGLDHHFSQVGNIRYDPSQLCSDMNTFSVNPQAATASSLLCKDSEKRVVLEPTFGHFSGTTPNHSDPQHFSSTWKSIGPQSSRSYSENNWLASNNHSQIFPCDHGLSGSSPSSLRIMNSNSTPMDHVQDMQCESLPSQNNIAFEMLASTHSNVRSYGLEVEPFNKPETSDDRANEPRQVNWILGPSYANQSFLEGSSNQWNSDRDHHDHNRLLPRHDINSNATQALYLTLSSVPSPKAHVADREASSVVNIPANISQQINPGPLGPFTGYATILESSKFLRPTQQLLDEICSVVCPKNIETSCDVSDPRNFEESSLSNDAENHLSGKTTSGMLDSCQPENLQKKAKLMFMQEEVCKRYKHYHQQMQMVVSSFESVSALSAATPYISLALKTVSKHFRNLKNAITNKLKTLKNTFGEDHLSSSSATKGQFPGSSSSSSMLMKFPEQSFQRPKSGGSIGIIENQHVWRPQRGLPEHAVSVLRAWLFDHFLHPYPTDTDKHMLAAQTGLTRNQVSNWFINARVRVWKPMVEEVHMLETEAALSETERNNPEKSNAHSTPDPSRNTNPNRSLGGPNTISHAGINLPPPNVDVWKSQEKRSRTTEYDHRRHQVANCDFGGSILGHVVPNPHHHSGLDMGGLGSVSLTLGLRQSAENGQMHHEHHRVRPCFGGQL